MTKTQEQFLDQYTRKLMVEVCRHVLTSGGIPPLDQVFIDYAVSKKWISADETRVLAAGWATAARFLKR